MQINTATAFPNVQDRSFWRSAPAPAPAPAPQPAESGGVQGGDQAVRAASSAMATAAVTAPAAASVATPAPAPEAPAAPPAPPPADLSKPPLGFPDLAYTSDPNAALVPPTEDTLPYVRGGIGTPPEVGQLAQAGGANFLNPQWQAMVADHAARNGGLGNEQDGFLAFSKHGFVRFYNENLTPEQNRRLAEISLQTGWPIEKMPSRAEEGGEHIDRWANKFLDRFDREFAAFQADPLNHKMSVKDGRRQFVLDFNEKAQAFVSYDYKKRGGFAGFVEKNMKWIGPVLNGLAMVGGPITAGIATAVRAGLNYVVTGTLKVRDLVAAGVAYFLPGGAQTVGQAVRQGVAQVAGSLIDNDGKLTAGIVMDGLAPYLGVKGYQDVVKAGSALANAIDTGKIDPGQMLGLVTDVFGDDIAALFKDSPAAVLSGIAKTVDQGLLSPEQAGSFLGRLIDTIRDDKVLRNVLKTGLKAAFDAVRGKDVQASQITAALTAFVADRLGLDEV